MGCEISKLSKQAQANLTAKKQKKLLFLGLDNAGKTSILLQMKEHQFNDQTRVPTVGLNIETITHSNYDFTLWDVGGSAKAARLWKHYFDNIDGILFCVDISDPKRMPQVKEMLWRINDPQLQGVPFLIYTNKTDIDKPEKMTPEQVWDLLLLESLRKTRPVRIQPCSALDGSGIWDGLNQMIQMIEQPGTTANGSTNAEGDSNPNVMTPGANKESALEPQLQIRNSSVQK